VNRLESEQLVLTADPACGGKLRSLISKISGREFFYQDRRTLLEPEKGYSYHDISGWDECFPSVAACCGNLPDGAAYDYPDHGALWQRQWDARKEDGVLTINCELEEYGCSFTRRCSFVNENTLLLDYRIENRGDRDIPYVYSAHPLLAVDASCRVVMPKEMSRAYNYVSAENLRICDGSWFDLSPDIGSDITGPFSAARHTFIKLFSEKLESGSAAVEYPQSGDRLVFMQDTAVLPHLGFLAQQGYDSLGDGYFAGECLLAFEPTTGVGDDIATCIQTGTLSVLSAGSFLSFEIRIGVERM
jgi:galactose mutarotase-like enzyme